MDVLCTEEEVLSLLHHMGHVIIGAVPAVADEDIPGTRRRVKPVGHIAEGPEFILVADGESACRPKKPSNSILVLEEPQETRKEMSLSAPFFPERVKSLPGPAAYCEMLDTIWLTASAKAAFMSSCNIIMYLLGIGLMFLSPISRAALTTSKIHHFTPIARKIS